MSLLRRLWERLVPSAGFERDLREELDTHLAHRADDLARAGVPREEAYRRARVEFGAIERYKELCRDESRSLRLAALPEQLLRDLQFGARRLRATPVFTLFAVISLAIGLGVTTAFYSSVYSVIWPAGGIRDVDRVAYITAGMRGGWNYVLSRSDFEELRTAETVFADVAAWTGVARTYLDGPLAEVFTAEVVSGNAFRAAQVSALRGRVLQPADDDPAADAALVISYAFWQRRLGGAPDVVGRTVRFGGRPFQIIGVADPAFEGFGPPHIGAGANGWISLAARQSLSNILPSATSRPNEDVPALSVFGRLAPHRSIAEAAAQVAAIGKRLDATVPRLRRGLATDAGVVVPRGWSAELVQRAIASRYSTGMAALLVGLVGLVLVVACTNLANLTLARGSSRGHDFAVRRALGASRWRLVREQLVESSLLAGAGGLLGFLVARLILAAAAAQVPAGANFELATELAPGVTTAACVATFVTLIVFGLYPALQLTRTDVRSALTADAGAFRWRTRRSLISVQVAVSAAFLFVAAMCVQAIASDSRADSGIGINRLALAQVDFRLNQVPEPRARITMDRILDLARAEPALEATALASGLPFGMSPRQGSLATAEHPLPANAYGLNTYVITATPGIFRVLNVPIVRGRAFSDRDEAATTPVAIMSAQTARALFGTTEAIGRRVQLRLSQTTEADIQPPLLTVVGVAQDTDTGSVGQRRNGAIYLPLAQNYESSIWLMARTPLDTTVVAGTLRTILRRADSDLAVGVSGGGNYLLAGAQVAVRMFAGVAVALGLVALTLSMAGLYGVLSHLVARRTREMGVRLALGASSSRLARMILADGSRPVVSGLVLGVFVGTLGRVVFRAVLNRPISLVDPLALTLVPIPLVVAAFVACYLPARRASRVDPNVALRDL